MNREYASRGKVRVCTHAPEFIKPMGQAKTVRCHGRVYSASTNGRVVFKLAHNSFADVLPRDDGVPISGSVTYTAARVLSLALGERP